MSTLSISSSIGEKWLSWANPYHELEKRISFLAQQAIPSDLSEQQKADLRQGFKLAHSWTWPAGRMNALLSTLPRETMTAFMTELIATANSNDVEYYLERCLSFFDEHSLLELSGFNTDKTAAAWFKISGLTKSTALKSGIEKEGRVIWKEFLVEFKYFIHRILEILMSALGLNEITRQKQERFGPQTISSFEAHAKLEAYLKLLALPATVFGLFYTYVAFKAPALLLTAVTVLASLTALVAYNRYWKPCPIDHAGMKNLTLDLMRENNPIYPRRDILKKIETAFQAKKGVILVGPPGAGKSWIVRSFAEQVSTGEIASFLNKAHVFSCNGSSMRFSSFDSTSFTAIEERFRQHRDQVIFFFDEFHSLFKSDGLVGSSTGDEIKTFCEDFRYVIGATTSEEYEEFVKNKPTIVDRRFEVIHIEPMERTQVKIALSQYLERTNSQIAFAPSVVDHIIDQASTFNSKTSTIDAAHALLSRAIQKMTSTTHSTLAGHVVQLEDKLGVIEQQAINGESILDLDAFTNRLNRVRNDLAAAKKELEQKDRQTQRMQAMESYRLKLKQRSYRLTGPHVDWDKNSALTRQWLGLHARIKIIEKFIADERAALGLPRCLDNDLIDSILAERHESEQA